MSLEKYDQWLSRKFPETLIMGVLNITPDSFSDGNLYLDPDNAARKALDMVARGADIIDIGGESTRPGSDPVSESLELDRVLPAIRAVRERSDVTISVDTTKARVAEKALEAGADMINDISGLTFEPEMADVASTFGAPVVIMHMKGTPKNMQENVRYENLIDEIITFLSDRIKFALEQGVPGDRIIIDPGIGFGKSVEDNFTIMKNLMRFKELGYPLLIGPSRKSFIGKTLNKDVDQRVIGTAAAVAVSIMNGADIIRVHDVDEMKQVAIIADRSRNRPNPAS